MLSANQIEKLIHAELSAQPGVVTGRLPDTPWMASVAEKIAALCDDGGATVAAAVLENEVTSTLVDMVAATVLATLIEEEGGGRTNICLSPASMEERLRTWSYEVTHRDMNRVIVVSPRVFGAWSATDEPPVETKLRQVLSEGEAGGSLQVLPDTPREFDRPLWAVRYFDKDGTTYLAKMNDRADAQRHVADYTHLGLPNPQIENRFCLHPSCPTSGCVDSEATSVNRG